MPAFLSFWGEDAAFLEPVTKRAKDNQPVMETQGRKGHLFIVLAFSMVMTLGVFLFATGPRATGDKVVVFVPPWATETRAVEVIASADGAFLRGGNRHWIALAKSDDPSFIWRLYRAGAFFVGSGEAFSACFPVDRAANWASDA